MAINLGLDDFIAALPGLTQSSRNLGSLLISRFPEILAEGNLTPFRRPGLLFYNLRYQLLRTRATSALGRLPDAATYIAAEMLAQGLPESYRVRAENAPAAEGALEVTVAAITQHVREVATLHFGAVLTVANMGVARAGADVPVNEATLAQLAAAFGRVAEQPETRVDEVSSLALIISSLSKQGNSTRGWLRSRVNQLSQEAGVDINMDQESIAVFYNRFGKGITWGQAQWQHFFAEVLRIVPPVRVRMRTTAQQARWSGMTPIVLIVRGTARIPDFAWGELADECHERERVNQAVEAARNHPYLMFSNAAADEASKGRIHSAKFPNILYAAVTLLKRKEGEGSLEGYVGGQNHAIRHKVLIDTWIDAYMAAQAAIAAPYPAREAIVRWDLGAELDAEDINGGGNGNNA